MMQIMLTGFLGKTRAKTFMTDLWDLLISAMESPDGIPNELVELKKLELQKKKVMGLFFRFGFNFEFLIEMKI